MIKQFLHIFLVVLWSGLGITYLITWESPEPWLAAMYVFLLALQNLISWGENAMDER